MYRYTVVAGKYDSAEFYDKESDSTYIDWERNYKYIEDFDTRAAAEAALATVQDYPFAEIEVHTMSNITTVENLLETTNQIDFGEFGTATSAVMTSITWSYAGQLVGAAVQLRRIHDPMDQYFRHFTTERKAEAVVEAEKRLDRLKDIVAWASTYGIGDRLPTGEQITDPERQPTGRAGEVEDPEEEQAAQLGIGVEELQTLKEEGRRVREEIRALQQGIVQTDRKYFARLVNQAVVAQPPAHLELSDRDAVRILETISEKLESHERRAARRGALTRRRKTRLKIGADLRLMADAMNKADEAAERIGMEEVAESESMGHNRRAQQQADRQNVA